jgi:hypothetical protein
MVSVALSQERNAPVLWVNLYNQDGALIEVGPWTVDCDGKWLRCGGYSPIQMPEHTVSVGRMSDSPGGC